MKYKIKILPLVLFLGLIAIALLAAYAGCGDVSICALAITPICPPDLAEELKKGLVEIQDGINGIRSEQEKVRADFDRIDSEFRKVRKLSVASSAAPRKGYVSEECARFLGAAHVLGHARSGRLDLIDGRTREALFTEARNIMGMQTRAALTTSDISLPTAFAGELLELVAQFGVARKVMTIYPIPGGTVRPARLGTQDDFSLIAMSAAVPEKNVKLTQASLESHKFGGVVRVPREIEEQSIVPIGQMLARYGARKFAKIEDTIAFLSDGTATYDSIKGVCQIASDNNKVTQLGATKTAPSDAGIADFRALRGSVASPVVGSGVYYCHVTWEQRLRTFKTQADPMIYNQQGPNGRPTLDGYDIIWTEILTPYGTAANPNAYIAVFGDLSFWWLGEHGLPRVDFSTDIYFTTDELATRFLEEIDVDYASVDAAAALKTAAA